MFTISMRRLLVPMATVLALFMMAVPTMADQHQWAPATDREDGVRLVEPSGGREAGAPPEAITAAGEAAVSIKSPSAVLMEASSGKVLFQKNAHERRNPASITKIMTLIAAFDAIHEDKVKMEDQVTISEEAAAQIGTIIFADANETFRFADLLRSVAVGSANDAAVAVAEHVSGSVEAFVQVMNQKAKSLGMNDTQFQNPTGLSAEGHFTSAYDIALMSRYAALHYPELIRLTAIYGDDLAVPWRKNGPTFRLWNNNKLLTWYQGADGLKTGWTEAAGYCLAATAQRENVRMISVVMGAETWKIRNAEAAKLLDFGFSNFTAVELAAAGKQIGTVRVARGQEPIAEAIPRGLFAVSVPKGEQSKVKMQVELTRQVEAPVAVGQVLGQLVATLGEQEIGRMDLVAKAAVTEANLWQTVLYHMKRLLTLQ